MEQKETNEMKLNGGLNAILLHQLPLAISRCWRAGLDPKQGKRAPLVTRAEEKLKTLEVDGVKGSDKLKEVRRQFDDSKTVRWADQEAQTNQ
jgi:hypothetical protein